LIGEWVFSTLRIARRTTPLYPNQRFGQRGKAAFFGKGGFFVGRDWANVEAT